MVKIVTDCYIQLNCLQYYKMFAPHLQKFLHLFQYNGGYEDKPNSKKENEQCCKNINPHNRCTRHSNVMNVISENLPLSIV